MRDDKDEARVRVPVDVRPSRRDLGGGDEGEGGNMGGVPFDLRDWGEDGMMEGFSAGRKVV